MKSTTPDACNVCDCFFSKCFIGFYVHFCYSAGAACIDTSNKFMTTAKDSSFETSLDIIGDLQTFVDGSVKVGEEKEMTNKINKNPFTNTCKRSLMQIFFAKKKICQPHRKSCKLQFYLKK